MKRKRENVRSDRNKNTLGSGEWKLKIETKQKYIKETWKGKKNVVKFYKKMARIIAKVMLDRGRKKSNFCECCVLWTRVREKLLFREFVGHPLSGTNSNTTGKKIGKSDKDEDERNREEEKFKVVFYFCGENLKLFG